MKTRKNEERLFKETQDKGINTDGSPYTIKFVKTGNTFYEQVKKFHEAFGHHVANKPTPMSKETALSRSIWTGEELVELLYATVGGDLNEFESIVDNFKQGIQKAYEKIKNENKPIEDVLTSQVDALTDIEYFNQGSFVDIGVEPAEPFNIVQEANMGKLWEDGKPRYREGDGKIVKPPNWEEEYAPEPRLRAEIQKQKMI
ncbi:HAD family hydrolase [Bacillus atrophaeus]|uniref:HAD family hydrolase n=1 Tax=Bacillus atrophaeus TaxID=1452 RepID=UPI003D22402C